MPAAALLGLLLPGPLSAQAAQPGAARLVPACTPELVHSLRPGREMDATSSGTGSAPNLQYTDADGTPRPPSSATVEWSARAVVDEPQRDTGVRPPIGGSLDVSIATAADERLTFTATCIADAGGFPFGLVVYANGTVSGGRAARPGAPSCTSRPTPTTPPTSRW